MIPRALSFQTQVAPGTNLVPAASSERLPAPDVRNGPFAPPPPYDVSFVAPVAPVVVVYLAMELAKALNGSAQSRRAETEQLQKELLHQLRCVPGVTAARYESIKSELNKALKGGATAFGGFVSWLKGELMGPTSDQQPAPPSAAQPDPVTPRSPRAASPAAAPAVDPPAARARQSALREAGSLNQWLVPQMQASQDAWNSAQNQMAQFYWQAAGGQAATPRLHAALAQLQGSIQELRKAHAQSNHPLVQLKSARTKLQAIQHESGGVGLARQTRGALGQVDKWAQRAEQWRTNLNQRIHVLEQWAQAAQTAVQARADAGAQGAEMSLALAPPAGAAPSVVQAARAAERVLLSQPKPANTSGGGGSATVEGADDIARRAATAQTAIDVEGDPWREIAEELGEQGQEIVKEAQSQGISASQLQEMAAKFTAAELRALLGWGSFDSSGGGGGNGGGPGAVAAGEDGSPLMRLTRVLEHLRTEFSIGPEWDLHSWLMEWLDRPCGALEFRRPIELIETKPGVRTLMQVIGAMGSGSYR